MTYSQSTGEIVADLDPGSGTVIGTGYSGHPPHVDDPTAQQQVDSGPLPRGCYTIAAPVTHPMLGPMAMRLTPAPENEMFGRGGFWIHGPGPQDDPEAVPPVQLSSLGCIVAPAPVRARIAARIAEG